MENHLVAPPSVPYGKLVIGNRMGPSVGAALHAVLLTADQHQVLPEHLLTTHRVHTTQQPRRDVCCHATMLEMSERVAEADVHMRCLTTLTSNLVSNMGFYWQ